MQPSENFSEHRRFLSFARSLVRLPAPGESPLDYLLPEARWLELLGRAPDPAAWLMALSQATGVYFFPSREWVLRLRRYLRLLRVTRVLEAGAGRGYLAAALAPLCRQAGIAFKAVDRGDGEFVSELPVSPLVAREEVLAAVLEFRPQVVLYAWPPPGQSMAGICRAPFLHYLIFMGEAGGGATGRAADWRHLPHKVSPALSRLGRGRTGPNRHQVTIFYGGARPPGGINRS
ncbi:MAG TPA: hypothetical protein VGA79_06255 [Desulfobaccales bacterium]